MAQLLIPQRFIPPTPEELKDKNVECVFDSEDKFELSDNELVQIIGKARPIIIPVLGNCELKLSVLIAGLSEIKQLK